MTPHVTALASGDRPPVDNDILPTTPPKAPQLSRDTSTLRNSDTLIKRGSATTLPFTTHSKFCIDSYHVLGKEIKDYLVGPMPVNEFLDTFFPLAKIDKLPCSQAKDRKLYQKTAASQNELLAYIPFVHTI